MAGIGEWHSLSTEQLKTAFDKAKSDNHDYLVKFSYTSDGIPMGMKGAGFLLDMIDFHETAYGVSVDSMTEDFRAILEKHPNAQIKGAYNLTRDFENAHMPEENFTRSQQKFDAVKEQIKQEIHQQRMDARPLWRKALGLQPK